MSAPALMPCLHSDIIVQFTYPIRKEIKNRTVIILEISMLYLLELSPLQIHKTVNVCATIEEMLYLLI